MSEGPGLYCLYKGDECQHFKEHEVEGNLADGWHDNPADAKLDAETAPAGPEDDGDSPEM